MKYLKLLIIITSILLFNSCGYKKLNSELLSNFKIEKLNINGEMKVAYKLKNNIEIYSSQNPKYTYDILINLSSTKESKIKNTAGKTTRYLIKLQANTFITDTKTQNVYKKVFTSSNNYEVGSTNSNTINNEKNAIENNINYISNEIIEYLKLLNI